MSSGLTLDAKLTEPELGAEPELGCSTALEEARASLLEGRGAGADMTGWLRPDEVAPTELRARIREVTRGLAERVDVLVVVGIGGSYLGARAAIEALGAPDQRARVRFAGQSLSASALSELLTELKSRRFALNIISKSGTTTEPAIAFRLLHGLLVERHGEAEAAELVFATTDPERGALRARCDRDGLKSFPVPTNVGGRFSVLSSVGLLPMAFCGLDIDAMVEGARAEAEAFRDDPARQHPALDYASRRFQLYRRGLTVEMLGHFEPRLMMLAEWWKQLFGESEGKQGGGLLPTALSLTTDLHSLGQYVQDGHPQLFETFLWIERESSGLTVPRVDGDEDGLGYLEGRPLQEVQRRALEGARLAHRDGGVASMTLSLERLDAAGLGRLFQFFEIACAVSARMLGVNPFDQPAVEDYKRNMFALLGKPGFEERARALRARSCAPREVD